MAMHIVIIAALGSALASIKRATLVITPAPAMIDNHHDSNPTQIFAGSKCCACGQPTETPGVYAGWAWQASQNSELRA
jgi:hypothetical protein